jgi:hypothetical protein
MANYAFGYWEHTAPLADFASVTYTPYATYVHTQNGVVATLAPHTTPTDAQLATLRQQDTEAGARHERARCAVAAYLARMGVKA